MNTLNILSLTFLSVCPMLGAPQEVSTSMSNPLTKLNREEVSFSLTHTHKPTGYGSSNKLYIDNHRYFRVVMHI